MGIHYVKAKKKLGQHFLADENISVNIVNALDINLSDCLLEIGPGTGVLTKYLHSIWNNYFLVEIDKESIDYLHFHYPFLSPRIISDDFLRLRLTDFNTNKLAIIGNFPYNISSQILFKIFEETNVCNQLVGMFQKEVALRICSKEGSRNYGILSVLIQTFYETEYLFTVPPHVFRPPPKVDSAVIRLKRNSFDMDDKSKGQLKKLVKVAFNQRRKILANALKPLLQDKVSVIGEDVLKLRAEQISVVKFIEMSRMLSDLELL